MIPASQGTAEPAPDEPVPDEPIPGEPMPDGSFAWRMIARGIAAVHIAFSLFVIAGSLVVVAWPDLIWVHLAAVAWAVATMIFDFGCPLTPWEKQAWRRGGRVPYEEGFVQHHILRRRFDPANTRRNHAVLAAGAVLVNAVVYAMIFRGR